jgi:hypothetical protein
MKKTTRVLLTITAAILILAGCKKEEVVNHVVNHDVPHVFQVQCKSDIYDMVYEIGDSQAHPRYFQYDSVPLNGVYTQTFRVYNPDSVSVWFRSDSTISSSKYATTVDGVAVQPTFITQDTAGDVNQLSLTHLHFFYVRY